MAVIASLSISLDGFYTGPNPSPESPMGEGGEILHRWFAHDVADRSQLTANDILRPEFERTGALAMGKDSYEHAQAADRKSTRLNSSHVAISYAVFCLNKKTNQDSREHL